MRPHRNPAPLPLLDHVGVGLLDESADPSEHLAPPIAQLLDARVDQPGGCVSPFPSFEPLLLFVVVAVAFFMGVCASSPSRLDQSPPQLLCQERLNFLAGLFGSGGIVFNAMAEILPPRLQRRDIECMVRTWIDGQPNRAAGTGPVRHHGLCTRRRASNHPMRRSGSASVRSSCRPTDTRDQRNCGFEFIDHPELETDRRRIRAHRGASAVMAPCEKHRSPRYGLRRRRTGGKDRASAPYASAIRGVRPAREHAWLDAAGREAVHNEHRVAPAGEAARTTFPFHSILEGIRQTVAAVQMHDRRERPGAIRPGQITVDDIGWRAHERFRRARARGEAAMGPPGNAHSRAARVRPQARDRRGTTRRERSIQA